MTKPLTKQGGILSRRLTQLFVPINGIQPTFLHKIRAISRKLCRRISPDPKLLENYTRSRIVVATFNKLY